MFFISALSFTFFHQHFSSYIFLCLSLLVCKLQFILCYQYAQHGADKLCDTVTLLVICERHVKYGETWRIRNLAGDECRHCWEVATECRALTTADACLAAYHCCRLLLFARFAALVDLFLFLVVAVAVIAEAFNFYSVIDFTVTLSIYLFIFQTQLPFFWGYVPLAHTHTHPCIQKHGFLCKKRDSIMINGTQI